CEGLHDEQGVDLRLDATVGGIEGGKRVERIVLGDRATVDADLVVVGIGVAPTTNWLESSSLALDNGVVCDETLLAAPGIVAAGDVCRWPNPLFGGEVMRLEHWANAAGEGRAAARRLLADDGGTPEAFPSVPFVWSDQYDRKIQTVGHFNADDEMEVVHGSIDDGRFVAIFGRAGTLVGALAYSMPPKLMQYRRM